MDRTIVKRYSLAELTLFGLFVAGLIGAWLIVSVRGRILLGEPVPLAGSGLSVSLPQGGNWQSLPDWQYEQDRSYVLISRQMHRGRSSGDVMWRYHLAPEPMTLKRRLELCAIRAGGRLTDCRQLDGPLKMMWGQILAGDSAALVGYCELDWGRILELQVRMSDEPWYAQDLFEAIGKAIAYEKSPAVAEGAALVQRLSGAGTKELFGAFQGQSNFVVRDSAGVVKGYMRENLRIEAGQTGETFRIEKTSSVNLPGFGQSEDVLTGVNPYKDFKWNSKSRGLGSVQGVGMELRYDADGLLETTDAGGEKASFRPGSTAVSELLIDSAAREMLNGTGGKVWLNVISGSGQLLPALAERIDAEQAAARQPGVEFAVRVMFINGSGLAEEIYFDSSKQVIGGLLLRGGRAVLLWERTTGDAIEHLPAQESVKGPVAAAIIDY